MTTKFCKNCGIRLPGDVGAIGKLGTFLVGGGGQKVYQFDDGDYCEKCAKIRVDKKRGKFNG